MRRGYIDPRRRRVDLSGILGFVGWVIALLIGGIFAWYALLGPGSTRGANVPEDVPSPTPTMISLPTATVIPTDTPAPAPTDVPLPTSTFAPLPTPLPTLTPTPQVTLTTGADGANVRSGPGTFYDILGNLDPGATATVTGRYEKWLRIDFEGAEGWVANWIVEVSDIDSVPQVEPPAGSETPTPEPTSVVTPTAEVTQAATAASPTAEGTTPVTPTLTAGVDGANVRTGPDTSFEAIGRLEPGETAVIIGRYDQWYQVDYNGTPAWIASWVVTATGAENVPEVEPPVASPTPEATQTGGTST